MPSRDVLRSEVVEIGNPYFDHVGEGGVSCWPLPVIFSRIYSQILHRKMFLSGIQLWKRSYEKIFVEPSSPVNDDAIMTSYIFKALESS